MSDPFHATPRRRLTPQQRAKIFVAHDGKCHKCGRNLHPGDKWTIAHIVALELGGTNDPDNLAPECEWCKPVVDREDHAKAAKARRTRTRHIGAHRPKRIMPGSRASRWKKKMDGTVVER